MPSSFHLGDVDGIRIEINASWLVAFVLIAASLALGWFPVALPSISGGAAWGLGIIGAVLLFLSVLAHELAHSLVARARGIAVSNITLFIFGGVSNIQEEPRGAGEEFVIAVVGPLTSLVIGVVAWGLARVIGPRATVVAAELGYLGVSNVLLGLFNLIPAFPLDGGRVLRSLLWSLTGSALRATRWATAVSEVLAALLILWGILLFFTGSLLSGLWLGFIGWFLLSGAQATNRQQALDSAFHGVRVAEVMNPRPAVVPASLSVERLVEEYVLPGGPRAVAVTQLGELVGLVTLRDLHAWPRDQWASVPVSYVMTPLPRLHTITPDLPLGEAIARMAHFDVSQLPVVRDGALAGMLGRGDIVRYLELRRDMRPDDVRHSLPLRLPRAS